MSIGVFIATAGAAAIAWWRASLASDHEKNAEAAQKSAESARDESLELSRKATLAFERQAVAQEEANKLEREARAPRAWRGPNWISESVGSYLNTSLKVMVILEWSIIPEDMSKFVRLHDHPKVPFEIPDGGQLRYFKIRASGARAEVLVVRWKYKGEDELHEANLPLMN